MFQENISQWSVMLLYSSRLHLSRVFYAWVLFATTLIQGVLWYGTLRDYTYPGCLMVRYPSRLYLSRVFNG